MNIKQSRYTVAAALVAVSLGLAGCGGSPSGSSSGTSSTAASTAANSSTAASGSVTTSASASASSSASGASAPAAGGGASQALAALQNKVLSTGPHGEQPTLASDIKLSDDEINQIKAKKATAAILMHYAGNDWSVAQVAGLKDQFGKMGINVIATTDANFNAATQVSNIETALAQKPSIIVSLPTDPSATADAFKKAAAAGVKLVFMDNVPNGMQQGKDYVSVVSADNYGNGVVAAHLMADKLGRKGKIGLIYHAADFFVTKQRYDAFKKTIQDNYPNIQIVEEQGIAGPDFSGDADRVASAMLTKHADLNGIWAVWDVPAEGVISAVRTAGRNDVIVTTCDLGKNVATDMAQNGVIKGLGAQRPFDQGVAEAMLAGYALLGKQAPPYVALNALPVMNDNLAQAWKTVYHQDPPAELAATKK